LREDFAAYSGNGSGSVFVKDLTGQTPFVPVTALQSIGLQLVNGGADPTQWSRMDVHATNAQVDNLRVTLLEDCNANGVPDDSDILDCDDSPNCGDCNANRVPDECDIAAGTSEDADLNGIPEECECVGDLNGDGNTDQGDLGILLANWQLGDGGDLDADGDTDQADLGILLGHWGESCQ